MKYLEFTDRTTGNPLLVATAHIISVTEVGKRGTKKAHGTIITTAHGTEEVSQSYDEVKSLLFNDGMAQTPSETAAHE